MGVVLNVLNVIAPGADLCAHIKKLGDDPLDEMGITYQVRNLAMLLRIVRLRFFRNFRELGLNDQKGPDEYDGAQNKVGSDNSQGLSPQVRRVCAR